MMRLCSTVIVYTEQQRRELLASSAGTRARILAAPNAMYRRDQIDAEVPDGDIVHILFSGRLVPSKKPLLLLDAFLLAIDRGLPADVHLVFAGDGPERPRLARRIHESNSSTRVRVLGHVPASHMRECYRQALVSVSTGYVGLSLVQSISFGVPMILANDEPHSPEIEAAIEGFNSLAFCSDDVDALAHQLIQVADNRGAWLGMRGSIANDCRQRYSIEAMAACINEAIR